MQVTKQHAKPSDVWARRVTYILTHFMRWFGTHWLALANVAVALYVGLPVLAPVLMQAGHERLAGAIYLVFRPLCHQMPERSYFIFGDRLVYSYETLSALLGGLVPQRWVGAAEIGYKVAVCQRCAAIFGFMLFGGLLFATVRHTLKPLSLKGFGALLVPMAIDGLGQLFHLWSSSWVSRTLTGGLFGLALIWLTYPYLEEGMREVREAAQRTLREWQG